MKLQTINLSEINKHHDKVLLVHWETGSVMPFEWCRDAENGQCKWMYTETLGEVYTIDENEESDLIKSIAVVVV